MNDPEQIINDIVNSFWQEISYQGDNIFELPITVRGTYLYIKIQHTKQKGQDIYIISDQGFIFDESYMYGLESIPRSLIEETCKSYDMREINGQLIKHSSKEELFHSLMDMRDAIIHILNKIVWYHTVLKRSGIYMAKDDQNMEYAN